MLSNLSLKCASSPESDHGVCNLNTLEVQVKKEDLKMSYFLLPGCHAVTKVQRFVFSDRLHPAVVPLVLTLTFGLSFASVLEVGALTE